MATAIGDIVKNFSGLADVNPYVDADFNFLDGNFQIISGSLRPASGTVFRYTAAEPTADIITCEIEKNHDSSVFSDVTAALIIDVNGDGYSLDINGNQVTIKRVDDGVTFTTLGGLVTQAYAVGARFRLELDVTTGDLTGYFNDTEIITRNDTTYDTGLGAGGFGFDGNTNASGFVSWAAGGYTAGPGITITQTELTPGATITGSGANYAGIPTNGSNVTISDGTNSVTAVLTITNAAAGAFDFSFTMPALPATGATANRILFNSTAVTVTIPDPGA